MRGYRGLLNISNNDHVTDEEARRKIQAAIGKYDELLILVKKWKLSKNNPTGHSERKKKKRQTEEE